MQHKNYNELNKKKREQVIVYNPLIGDSSGAMIDIFRIELNKQSTRIDFVAYPDPELYDSRWLHQIERDSFIRMAHIGRRFKLIHAINIPFEPRAHSFKYPVSCLPFTLIFEPIPLNAPSIDIIEKDIENGFYFNFFNVSLEKKNRKLFPKFYN